MKAFFFSFAFIASALALSSCGGTSGDRGSRVVYEPTVDQMARIDREMGLEPKKAGPRYTTDDSGAVIIQQRPQQPAPQPQAPAPEAAPQPQIPALPVIPPNSNLR